MLSATPMAAATFFQDAAKKRTEAAVKSVESKTAAELVVAVRRSSGHYRVIDLSFGAVAALLTLAFQWLSPIAFDPALISLNVALTFAVAAVACGNIGPLRRLLAGKRCRAAAELAAKAAFVDLGISKTTGRTGILVFVSMFERTAVVVPDVAVDRTAIEGFAAIETAIERAVRAGDFDAFVAALESLGPTLAPALPRSEDDVNELPDEVA
jgi:putative membrane protein